MTWLSDLAQNHILINSLCAWTAAQVIKTLLHAFTNKTLDLGRLFGDGGMPSGHSATVTAMAVTAGREYGLSSPAFAIAAIMAIVVMHDAMGVRMEAGKHAKALNELLETISSDSTSDDKLKELLGHTPLQVFFGVVLGFAVAFLLT